MSSVTRARTASDHVDLTGGHLGGERAAGEPLVQQQRIDGGGVACGQVGADLPSGWSGRRGNRCGQSRRISARNPLSLRRPSRCRTIGSQPTFDIVAGLAVRVPYDSRLLLTPQP